MVNTLSSPNPEIDDIINPETAANVAAAGFAANQVASSSIFADYHMRKAKSTLRRQKAGLDVFSNFLAAINIENAPSGEELQNHPKAWQGVTWGLIEAFKRWMLQQNYAVGTVNIRLSTIRTYVGLASKAGVIPQLEAQQIASVKGYSRNEAVNLDSHREKTRRPKAKKAHHVTITYEQAQQLKRHPDTPQGRRDRLLMCLLLDHGLRVSEVSDLTVKDVANNGIYMTFYRKKVKKSQRHKLTSDTLEARDRYYSSGDAPDEFDAPLLRSSLKDGTLDSNGMTTRAITKRVRVLGKAVGLHNLSAHDCRHYWATYLSRSGTDGYVLREAGGWLSTSIPARYIEDAKVANEGVKGFNPESKSAHL